MFGTTCKYFLLAFLATTWAYPQDYLSEYNAVDLYSGRDSRDYGDESTFSDDFDDDARDERQAIGMASSSCVLEPLFIAKSGKGQRYSQVLKQLAGDMYSESNDALQLPELITEAIELRNNVITGLEAVMDSAKATLTGHNLRFDVKIPRFEYVSQYKLNVSDVSGQGKMLAGVKNVDEQAILKLNVDKNTGKVSIKSIKEIENKNPEIYFSMENLVFRGKSVDWPWLNKQVNQDLRTISNTWLASNLLKLIETEHLNGMLLGCPWDTLKKYQKT